MKSTFLGEVFTRVNKNHDCFGCGKTIKPDPSKKTQIRHDVWKVGKTVVNKYYCKNCEILVDFATENDESCDTCKPYNPEKNKFKKFKYSIILFFIKMFNET